MPSLTASQPPESEGKLPTPATLYTVGTLRYDQRQLYVLFFWLMWNDFSITLIEKIGVVNGILMRDRGATFTQMAILGSIGGFIFPWINPWVSTWSDRHRGRFGRRRPFLLFATPIFATFLMAVPYMPTLYQWLVHRHIADGVLLHLPFEGGAFLIGCCGLASGLFNSVVMAIFLYLYWDVVPMSVMGRFQSLSSICVRIAGLVWSFFIFGMAESHPRYVYVGTGAFCLVVYLVSTWQIKEGEYPPPDPHTKGGHVFAPIRAYFVECYREPYYLWIFGAMFFMQLGNVTGGYQFWYLHTDLGLSLNTIGWAEGWTSSFITGFGMLCGFWIGTMTDKLKPVRIVGPIQMTAAFIVFISFFWVHDQWSLLITSILRGVVQFAAGIAFAAFQVEVFPREKLGQFCSAQAVFYQVPINLIQVGVARYYDWAHNNRQAYLWMALFYSIGALFYMKVYANWKLRHGHVPVPHAG